MARENFDRALRLVLLHEGGYVDHHLVWRAHVC